MVATTIKVGECKGRNVLRKVEGLKHNKIKTSVKEKMNLKCKLEYAYGAGYDAGVSNTTCICKHRSPIEEYTLITKEEYMYLLRTVNNQSVELAKEKE